MEKIIVSELDKQLFEKEINTLKKASNICNVINNNEHLNFNQLKTEYLKLTAHYEKVLRSTIKITNIGDKNQQKLYYASEKIKQQKKDIEQRNNELYRLSISDYLTKIYNRTFIIEKLEEEYKKAYFADGDLCCVLFDIDHFKDINDNYGHLVGDFVLEKLSKLVKSSIPDSCYLGRYGGEEFLIIIPKTNSSDGKIIADKIRKKIKDTQFIYNSLKINVSISVGVTDNNSTHTDNIDDLLNNSDRAMYQAKKLGRNQTVVFSEN